jgi:hypothetical protein
MLWHQDPTATPVLVFILATASAALAVFTARLGLVRDQSPSDALST